MAEFTVCVTDKRHESYDLEREIRPEPGWRSAAVRQRRISSGSVPKQTGFFWTRRP